MRALAILILGASLVLPGCGSDDGPTTTVRGSGRPIVRRIKKIKPRAAGARAPRAPGVESSSLESGPFVYKPGRDPFQSYFDIGEGPQLQVKLQPLQKHPLNRLKVVAIITGTVQPAAMVVDPSGKPFLIKRGTLVGPPRGRVARILSDRIVVEREYKDRLERVHRLVHEIKIRKDLSAEKDEAGQ